MIERGAIDAMVRSGCNEWRSDDGTEHRVYINEIARPVGLDYDYAAGQLTLITLDGIPLDPVDGGLLLRSLPFPVYLDVANDRFVVTAQPASMNHPELTPEEVGRRLVEHYALDVPVLVVQGRA